jgi:Cu-Zn family superoxide dismutase
MRTDGAAPLSSSGRRVESDLRANGEQMRAFKTVCAVAVVAAVTGCSSALSGRHQVAAASASLSDVGGHVVGTAQLWQGDDGVVHVDVRATRLTPGMHGIHFHAVGSCEGAAATPFSAAGSHYNPLGKQHGLNNASGPHAGDAPNLEVGADGTGHLSFTTNRITLVTGPTSLFDSDGSAIVIHGGADDQTSQPAGNSGARVACGVVRAT